MAGNDVGAIAVNLFSIVNVVGYDRNNRIELKDSRKRYCAPRGQLDYSQMGGTHFRICSQKHPTSRF